MNSTLNIQRLEIVGEPRDMFAGIPDLTRTFFGITDYLSLWVQRYGLRETDIVAEHVGWLNEWILTFRIVRRRGRYPIHMRNHDSRLDSLASLRYRRYRVRNFIGRCKWYRDLCMRVDDNVRSWMETYKVDPTKLEVVGRWTIDGNVIIKMVPPFMNRRDPRRYMTHYKQDRP